MPLTSIVLPNLITGVSQQPPALRLASSFKALTNTWPSVVTGLNKRPPTEHVANIGWNPFHTKGDGRCITLGKEIGPIFVTLLWQGKPLVRT